MKAAAVVILACILLSVLVLFLAAMALGAARRARLRGEKKGNMDFGDGETLQFSREIIESRGAQEDDDEE